MSTPGATATVNIVDDHLLFATALADLVGALPDFIVAAVSGTGREAVAAAAAHQPDLILLDFHLPGVLATDLLPELRAVSGASRIIILTSDTSSATRESAMAAGVDGFLTKEQALDDIAAAVRAALDRRAEVPTATVAREPAVPGAVTAADEPGVTSLAAHDLEQDEADEDERRAADAAPARAAQGEDAAITQSVPPLPITSVADLRRRPSPPPAAGGRGAIVAVYGAKGGVGTTTVATGLGVTLARMGARTVLVDLDLGFGDVGVFLDLEGGPGIADVALGRIDADQLSRSALRHSSGLRVVATAPTPIALRPDPPAVLAALESLRDRFSYVLCDVPRVLGPLTVAVLRAVDVVLIVTTPELPALRDLERVLARGSLGLRSRGLLVVNRHPTRSGIALLDIERALGVAVRATVPSRGVAVTDAINRGVPVARGGTQLGRAFRELAVRLTAVVPAPIEPRARPSAGRRRSRRDLPGPTPAGGAPQPPAPQG